MLFSTRCWREGQAGRALKFGVLKGPGSKSLEREGVRAVLSLSFNFDAVYFFLFFKIYLFMRDTERGIDTEGEADSLQGPRDHTLSQRQMLNHWATQVPHWGSLLTRCSIRCLRLLGHLPVIGSCFCLQTEHTCSITFGLDRRLNVYNIEKQDQRAFVELLECGKNT